MWYGEPIKKCEYRGAYKTVGAKWHADLIGLYVEDGLSIDKIACRLSRSARTVSEHVVVR